MININTDVYRSQYKTAQQTSMVIERRRRARLLITRAVGEVKVSAPSSLANSESESESESERSEESHVDGVLVCENE